MPTHTDFRLSTKDGLQLHGQTWAAERPVAIIALVHGMGEHIARYDHLAAYFNARGVTVVGFDQRGHGRSDGKRGHAPTFDVLLDSVAALLVHVEQHHHGLPVWLYGHSMGGNLVLNYLLRRHPHVSGVVATGPWVQLAFQPPRLLVFIARLLCRVLPTLAQPTNLDASALSHVVAVVEAYKADPLVHGRITTAMSVALLNAADWLHRHEGPVPCPLLLMHGAADAITSAKATEALASRLTGDVTLRLWPGLFHEIHNEPVQKEVFGHIMDWMRAHSKGVAWQ